jgi:hypothetical protein
MGMLKFEIAHTLTKDEAKRRTEALLGYWARKYGVQTTWNGDLVSLAGKVMGVSLGGTLHVDETKVGGEATDPGLLFRDKARKYLTRKFAAYLAADADLASLERGGE